MNNYDKALTTLTLCEEREEFRLFLEEARSKTNQPLASLLIMPVQRVPRYVRIIFPFPFFSSNNFLVGIVVE